MKAIVLIILVGLLIVSCEDDHFIPKPPTYLRLELPEHAYKKVETNCPYSFELPQIYALEDSPEDAGTTCHKRIQLGPLNGTAYLRYWKIGEGGKDLAFYINGANDEVGRHKVKATNIQDETIRRPEQRVFGSFFALEGNVATPFQFYLTDSTENFMYCEVLFNSAPNYDSIKPTLDYLKVDLDHLINTVQWKQ